MKTILKKNQLMITALAIMIAVAGYLQFTSDNLKKEDYLPASADGENSFSGEVENFIAGETEKEYVLDDLWDLSDSDLDYEGFDEIESLDSDVEEIVPDYPDTDMDVASSYVETPEEGEIPGEAVFTASSAVGSLTEAKMLKEQIRAKNKETLMEIINSTTLSDEQKQNAVNTMVAMTTIAEQETSAEILLEAKGFEDVVVSISDTGVDVVVNAEQLTDAQRAQIEDIVRRKTNQAPENIIISTVVR